MKLSSVVTANEFQNFMADYNDHKTSLVKFGDFSIIQEEVEQLKKNCQTMVSKKDFYDR